MEKREKDLLNIIGTTLKMIIGLVEKISKNLKNKFLNYVIQNMLLA